MFGQQTWYPPNVSYNPYLHSSYQRPPPFEPIPTRVRRSLADEQAMQERARVLAEQRARRSQYLPDEDVDSESEWDYNQVGPRQQAYLEARRRQGIMERRRREEELRRQRVLEEQKWQEDLERKQREDQELHRKLLEERKRELRLKREEGARQEGREKVPLVSHEDTSISVAHQETPPPSPPKPSPTEQEVKMEVVEKDAHTPEEMNEAAARIQRQYRMYRSSGALNDIATEFEKLKKEFVYPCVIDFQKSGGQGGHITVPACRPPSDFDGIRDEAPMEVDGCEGKLGYTSTNYALNAYSDALDKLLMKLDGVESCGDERIRMKRRGIVKDIEKEVARFEWYWKQAWADYIAIKGNQ